MLAYSADENHRLFSAAIRPECVICLAEVKEVVLDPCRHLVTCSNCAVTLTRLDLGIDVHSTFSVCNIYSSALPYDSTRERCFH